MAITPRRSFPAAFACLLCIAAVGLASPVALETKDAPEIAAEGGKAGAEGIVSGALSGIAKTQLQEEEQEPSQTGTNKVSV